MRVSSLLIASTVLVNASSEAGSGAADYISCVISDGVNSDDRLCASVFGGSHSICGTYTGSLAQVNGAYNRSELVKEDGSLYLQTMTLDYGSYWFITTSSWAQYEENGYVNMERAGGGPWDQLAYAGFDHHDAYHPHNDYSFCNMENPVCPDATNPRRGWKNGGFGTTDYEVGQRFECAIKIECTHRPSCPTAGCGTECCSSRAEWAECQSQYESRGGQRADDYEDSGGECMEHEYHDDGRGCPGGPEGGCRGGCCLGAYDDYCSNNYREGFVCRNNACGDDDCCVPAGTPVGAIVGGVVVALILIVALVCCIVVYCIVRSNQQARARFQQQAATARATAPQPMQAVGAGGIPQPVPHGGGGVQMGSVAAQAQPAPQMMAVAVPAGVGPGAQLMVTGPNGQSLTVVVPDGVGPGQQFMVSMPAPQPVMATATAVPIPMC